MLKQLHCPSCNAPLHYDGVGATIECLYCDTKVVVPVEWRTQPTGAQRAVDDGRTAAPDPAMEQVRRLIAADKKLEAIKVYREAYGVSLKQAKEAVEALERAEPIPAVRVSQSDASASTPPAVRGTVYDLHQPPRRGNGCAFSIVILTTVLIIGAVLATVFGAQWLYRLNVEEVTTAANTGSFEQLTAQLERAAVQVDGATLVARFGDEGIGPGKFVDARAIAVDNAGRLYVGEYTTGRIQVFDVAGAAQGEAGRFIGQWKLGNDDFYVDQFSADRKGVLYIPYAGQLSQHDGVTGELLGALPMVEQAFRGRYDDSVAIGADGAVYAVWDNDIVRFDTAGNVTLRIRDAIATAVGGGETTTVIAVDGLGAIYALGESQDVLVKFDASGRFVDRITGANRGADEDPAKLRAGGAVAVDSKGRVYVSDIFGIKVFDGDGHYLRTLATPGYAHGLAITDDDLLFVAARTEVQVYQLHP